MSWSGWSGLIPAVSKWLLVPLGGVGRVAVGAELATVLSYRAWADPTKRDLLEDLLPVRVEAGAVDGVLFDRVVHWCRVRAVLVGRQVEGLFDLLDIRHVDGTGGALHHNDVGQCFSLVLVVNLSTYQTRALL